MKDLTVVSPNTAKFTAKLKAGEPRADIQWFKAGKKISPNKKYTMSFEDDSVSLEISDTTQEDADQYSFEAVNKVGKVTSKATLTVHGKYVEVIHAPSEAVIRHILYTIVYVLFTFLLYVSFQWHRPSPTMTSLPRYRS